MIDGRETPRRAIPGELGEPSESTPRRLSRLATAAPAAKRMATTRVGMAIGGSVILALVLALVTYTTRNWVRNWLHNQPVYQLNFADIELDPPCPKWIKSGQVGILEKVRKGAKRPVSFSVLDLDVDALRNDFLLNSPWIARVDRVVKLAGNRVRVQLEYREPVGYLGQAKVYLDGHGVVLPNDDIDLSEIGFVLKIIGESPGGSVALTPGHDLPDDKLRAAANLAGFLKQRLSSLEPRDNPARPVAIHVSGPWLETKDKNFLQWGELPGNEKPGSLTSTEKCAIFASWASNPNRVRADRDRAEYLYFTKDGIAAKRNP